jgi:glutamate dehydrogenase (NAD(P)+)
MRHRKETGSVLNFPGAANLAHRNDALELECDILIPAALENQITEENASRVKAKIIAEGANGPTTAAAEQTLAKKNILVIPDIYLNAGGVTVSYFEWLKNLSHVRLGRMGKRFEQRSFENILDVVETTTGQKLSAEERRVAARGADEIDIVNSGLEENDGYRSS